MYDGRQHTQIRVCCELFSYAYLLRYDDCKISCLTNIFPKQLGILFYNWILDF